MSNERSCKFNIEGRCNNIGIISARCEEVGCEYKITTPYTYPRKEDELFEHKEELK